jgi:hypothetical protein
VFNKKSGLPDWTCGRRKSFTAEVALAAQCVTAAGWPKAAFSTWAWPFTQGIADPPELILNFPVAFRLLFANNGRHGHYTQAAGSV